MADEHDDSDKTKSYTVLAQGTMVGHYLIIEKIGAGGMGEVYLAQDTELDRKVALKFLPPHLCQDEDCRKRFKREAQTAAKLTHPNIVTVHEVGEYNGRPFFAMEHVEGFTLRALLKDKRLDLDRIVEMSIQICEGLNKAHQSGITHRDIKPANIIVDADGHPRLLDFGLAAVLGGEHLTRSGTTLGTVGYMSPEQVKGETTDVRSDLFSFGVVLYEMIAGLAPFRKENEAATMHAIVNDDIERLSRHREEVPDDLAEIVAQLLEKKPDRRYQTAGAVLNDLQTLYRTGHISISAPRIRRRMRRVGKVAALTAMIVLVVWGVLHITNRFRVTSYDDRIMLAVLPFENLGDPDQEYFADGITDEIASRLASVHNLGVISRTSAYAYKESDKTLPEIAKELGANYILEGTVRWDKAGDTSRVRITPQLIKVSDDSQLWSGKYEETLTEIFALQSTIASSIVQALDLALSESDHSVLALMPTNNPEAFDCYLRGKRFDASNTAAAMRADSLLRRAVDLDPEFALAHARLGYLYVERYWWSQFYEPSPEWLTKAKRHIDSALTLQPDLANAYATKGWYYFRGDQDYPSAQRYLELVIQRRRGQWSEARRNFDLAFKLNPRSGSLAATFAGTLVSTRNYEKAEKMFDRAGDINPNAKWLYVEKSMLYLLWTGDTRQARDVIDMAIKRTGRWSVLSYVEVELDLIDGNYEHALALCSKPGVVHTGAVSDSAEYYYIKAKILQRYQPELAVAYCDSARVQLEREISDNPDAFYSRAYLGQVYAWLGRDADGMREGIRAVELYPMAKDAVSAPDLIGILAEIYISVADYESAINQLEFLLSVPSWVSVPYLRVDPKYDPLRDHPRFQALMEKYGGNNGT